MCFQNHRDFKFRPCCANVSKAGGEHATRLGLKPTAPEDVVRQVADDVVLADDGLPHVGEAPVVEGLQCLGGGGRTA